MHAITERFLGDLLGEDNKGFIVYSTIPGIEALVYAKEAIAKKNTCKRGTSGGLCIFLRFWVYKFMYHLYPVRMAYMIVTFVFAFNLSPITSFLDQENRAQYFCIYKFA